MIVVDSPFPPGEVVVVSADLTRFVEFSQSLLKLLVPRGTKYTWTSGTSIESNRNLAVDGISREAQWVYFIDDDHVFKPDILMQLLQRMMPDDRVDIIQGLCMTRKPPYFPYAYLVNTEYQGEGINYINCQWSDLPTSGISEWDGVGTGGMLVRRTVFEKMDFPWFETGKTFKDVIGEDLYFCYKAKQLGFRVWVDSDNRTGHMHTHANWPMQANGEWALGLDLGKDVKIAVPQSAWSKAMFDEVKVPVKK